MISEFRLPGTDERVLLNVKEHCTVLLLDGPRALAFDPEGRLLYDASAGAQFRRGMNNDLLRLGADQSVAPADEASARTEAAYGEVARVMAAAPPGAREALDPIARFGAERAAQEARRFAQTYGRVPVLPPDQYRAVYLQATVGCASNRCTFCTFYRDVPFRARSVDDFERHLRQVLELLGRDVARRPSIFLGDANALAVPTPDLAAMMRLARAALPGREFHCFADAQTDKGVEELRELASLGLRRVTIGLETAHEPLYRRLCKPGSVGNARRTIESTKAAGLNVGISVLLGAGGGRFLEAHVADTADFLLAQPLGPGDFVYLSPLRGQSVDLQRELLRHRLRAFARERGVRIANYDISRFIY